MQTLEDLDLVYQRERRVGKYSIDFYLGQHLCIEVQGEYWHSKPDRIEKDARKKAFLESEGYSIIYINESEVDTAKQLIIQQLKEMGFPLLRSRENNHVNASKSGVRIIRANGGRKKSQSRAKPLKGKV